MGKVDCVDGCRIGKGGGGDMSQVLIWSFIIIFSESSEDVRKGWNVTTWDEGLSSYGGEGTAKRTLTEI